ncbi:MAG: lamin tail domain-containing protein [Patescibacteria group bacterium]|nr:lamin tail domain-containing protein [Patescibacteria group bacterium]
MKIHKNPNKYFPNLKKQFKKFLVIFMVVSIFGSIFTVNYTYAYFSSSATASGNTFTAGTLIFHLNPSTDFTSTLSKGDSSSPISTTITNNGSLDFQYTSGVTDMTGDTDLCNALSLDASMDNTSVYNGSLSSFETTPQAYSSSPVWSFVITLPSGVDDTLQDKSCNFKFTFKGWQKDLLSTTGFSNIEQINGTINSGHWVVVPVSSGVVLNEFLPNPDGIKYGYDFGSDSDNMPKGEWVELYNNGNKAVDLTGWYIRDSLDTSNHTIMIDTAHTGLSSQTIDPKGFLVVYMNKALFNNNSGDSVRLFDNNDKLIDSHSYTTTSDYCNLKPTESSTNNETGSGTGKGCTSPVPENKSYARIPDGIGAWVDPIPTPGKPNEINSDTATPEPVLTQTPDKTTESNPTSDNTSAVTNETTIDTKVTDNQSNNIEQTSNTTVDEQKTTETEPATNPTEVPPAQEIVTPEQPLAEIPVVDTPPVVADGSTTNK